jgi:hypothetical protein
MADFNQLAHVSNHVHVGDERRPRPSRVNSSTSCRESGDNPLFGTWTAGLEESERDP